MTTKFRIVVAKKGSAGSVIKHGEMGALENAGRQKAPVYRNAVLYNTLSPCAMCSGMVLLYGKPRVVIGENRTFQGEEKWLRYHGVSVEILDEPECYGLMQAFIRKKAGLWYEGTGLVR